MSITNNEQTRPSNEASGDHSADVPVALADSMPAGMADQSVRLDTQVANPRWHRRRKWVLSAGAAASLVIVAYFLVPWVVTALNTVSTDDAYVNGDVTFVAPRVSGQVTKVLVRDNNRVKKGDLLVQLDREPYQVRVNIAKAALGASEADLVATRAKLQGVVSEAGSLRFALEHAMEDVRNQVSLIHSKVAVLKSRKAILDNAQYEHKRVLALFNKDSAPEKELNDRITALQVAQTAVEEALHDIYQVRVNLGLSAQPQDGDDLTEVPENLDQTATTIREAQARLINAVAQLGVTDTLEKTPGQMLADFCKRDPEGNIDRIFVGLLKEAPAIKQAEARLAQARRNLDQAELDIRYCDITSEIDGVVTRKNVNPGNNVQVGQSLMAIRSLTEIWIDANFKETQLADLRIGQRVLCEVDMYGDRHEFEGRISGFTMGTGQTLALLPPQNATGNFVKIVQRLPVRIELSHYDPDEAPLFVGLSVEPYVYYKEPPSGPNAGEFLQPRAELTTSAAVSHAHSSFLPRS
jgi:membrane fusion protein (multidrug efflux system)